MTERHCEIAIIGAGTAGLKAYKTATARAADVVIVERGPGGSTCTRVGCMPSKLLLAAANVAQNARTAGAFGIETGPVGIDAAAMWARVRAERDRFVASVLDDYHAIPADRVIHGSARFLGPDRVRVGDVEIVAAKGIVIATGATPIVPDALDPVRSLVHTHETIFELDHLPQSLGVLGAGPLGLELAQAFARLGVEVTVIDDGDAVGGLADPAGNAAAIAALEKEVRLVLGVEASASMAADGRAHLQWSSGSAEVDLVLAATGRPPSFDGLALEATGITLDEHGTPVFEKATHRCGESKIYVAGDAGAWRPVLHEAARGGQVAADAALGGAPARLLPAFSIAFTEPNLVEVGTALNALPEDAKIGEASVADNGRATIEGKPEGLVRLYADAGGTLLGGSIVAHGGEHLGHLLALAIDRGIDARCFADQAWYHPTIEELLQSAARDLIGEED